MVTSSVSVAARPKANAVGSGASEAARSELRLKPPSSNGFNLRMSGESAGYARTSVNGFRSLSSCRYCVVTFRYFAVVSSFV